AGAGALEVLVDHAPSLVVAPRPPLVPGAVAVAVRLGGHAQLALPGVPDLPRLALFARLLQEAPVRRPIVRYAIAHDAVGACVPRLADEPAAVVRVVHAQIVRAVAVVQPQPRQHAPRRD